MSKAPELAICAKLTRKAQVLPSQGGGFIGIDKDGKTISGSYITDDGKRLVNPDGPEAAEIIKELVKAARPFADSIVIDPAKKRGERHWATCGKLTNLDDVLRLQAALSRAGANNDQSK